MSTDDVRPDTDLGTDGTTEGTSQPAPDDSDVSGDLWHEIEQVAGSGAPPADERDEPAFDSGSQGMDTPPAG